MEYWKILKHDYLLQTKWLTVRKDRIELPNQVVIDDFYVLEYPDWINVIAITDNNEFIIEKQYRHGLQKVCYELCAGVIEVGETAIESAKRELLEETGYGDGNWTQFCVTSPNSNSMNNYCYTFLAQGVRYKQKPSPEVTENISIHLLSKKELITILKFDGIVEGVMSAPLWKYLCNNDIK